MDMKNPWEDLQENQHTEAEANKVEGGAVCSGQKEYEAGAEKV